MSKATPRLGKGLSALIGPRPTGPFKHRAAATTTDVAPSAGAVQATGAAIRELPLDRIRPNPRQPRLAIDQAGLEQLADSLRQTGVLQPILVRILGDDGYELVAGERRWRAAAIAELETIPAIVRELSDADSFLLALTENLQREDLGPLERAAAYQQLIDTLDVSVDELAQHLAQSRANIVNYLRLLKLSEKVQALIGSGELGMGQARAIAGISNPQRQLAVALLAVRRNLSVRQVEDLAKRADENGERIPRRSPAADAHLADVARSLSKALGLPVTLHPGKKKNSGRVVIRYNSLDEFDRVADKIAGHSAVE